MAPPSSLGRILAAKAKAKARAEQRERPSCWHNPYRMLYIRSEAMCQDCGTTWLLGEWGWSEVRE